MSNHEYALNCENTQTNRQNKHANKHANKQQKHHKKLVDLSSYPPMTANDSVCIRLPSRPHVSVSASVNEESKKESESEETV